MKSTAVGTDSMITTRPLLDAEHTFKTESIFSKKTVDIIIPFFNEFHNVVNTHHSAKKLEKLFHINNYIYINNGSKDDTLGALKKLATEDGIIKIIDIKKNIGYGNGFKKGFESSTADFIITNHADEQFDAFHFYSSNLEALKTLDLGASVFSVRKGRPFASTLFTRILRATLSIILGVRLKEFNGQPKLINKPSISIPIDKFPNDFSFDLMLYLAVGDKKFYPILEQTRSAGESSWNHGLASKFRLFRNYISSTKGIKKSIKLVQL